MTATSGHELASQQVVSMAGMLAVAAATSLSVGIVVVYGPLALASVLGGSWLDQSLSWQEPIVIAATFLVCLLMRADLTLARRTLGALIAVAAGLGGVLVAGVPLLIASLVSFTIEPLGLWAACAVGLVVIGAALARTNRHTRPGRGTVVVVGLLTTVLGTLAIGFPWLAIKPVSVTGPVVAFQLHFVLAGSPLLTLAFGAAAGLGCALWPVKIAPV